MQQVLVDKFTSSQSKVHPQVTFNNRGGPERPGAPFGQTRGPTSSSGSGLPAVLALRGQGEARRHDRVPISTAETGAVDEVGPLVAKGHLDVLVHRVVD